MKVKLDRFPGGRFKALTLSYDDGRTQDRQMIGIMNKYGIRGTFHLNSGNLGAANYVTREELPSLYAGHEVSAHTVSHPFLEQTPKERVALELLEDRRTLEQLAGYPVTGMSYPYGTHSAKVVEMLPALGIRYARTTRSTGGYGLPSNPLLWEPTCKHSEMLKHGEAFLALAPRVPRMALLYVWGHSYEFDNDGNWDELETFCRLMGGKDDIWYATNIEIIDYMEALGRIRFSVDESLVHNPNAIPVWIGVNGVPVELAPGSITRLDQA